MEYCKKNKIKKIECMCAFSPVGGSNDSEFSQPEHGARWAGVAVDVDVDVSAAETEAGSE